MSAHVRAVVLAAGRGTRMRAPSDTPLDAAQEAFASRGLKSLIPFAGKPYIQYGLESLADAGIDQVCIVIGPDTEPVRSHLESARLPVAVTFAVQRAPWGSADAVVSAESCVGGAPFILVNADNIYPARDVARLVAIDGCGLIGYDRDALVAGGIPEPRIRAFALLDVDASGALRSIVEKPDPVSSARMRHAPVSMTCWRFDARIFDACRGLEPSPRGELELPDAVMRLVQSGVRFEVLPSDMPVLDLSTRADVPIVAAALQMR